ncbi:S1C family serine protease [Ideonella sp. A 288]|uniref:S1C family serine protease n=1 Tax=Ideonella sp. A 288 TaxID=1962181 RepID=UPI0013038B26|nr:S1C family serine protease [Ideonella sp. A 288]
MNHAPAPRHGSAARSSYRRWGASIGRLSPSAGSRRAGGSLVALALVLAGLPALAQPLTPAEVFAKVSPSLWKVIGLDADGLALGQGSAVVVAPQTLVTNCHVLAKAKRVLLRRNAAPDSPGVDARLSAWDVQRDLCQLTAAAVESPAVALGRTEALAIGQPAYAIGHPRGLDLTMSEGLVSSLRRNAAGQLLLVQTSAAISGGSSGGGLFDDQGALVGLTTIASVSATAQNLNFAIPAEWIRDLPRRHAALRAAASASSPASAPTGTR